MKDFVNNIETAINDQNTQLKPARSRQNSHNVDQVLGPRKAKTESNYGETTPRNPDPASEITVNCADTELKVDAEEEEDVLNLD